MSKCRPGATEKKESLRAAGQDEVSCQSSRTGRNVFWKQQDTSKCRLGATRQVEMSSWSSRRRNVVPEQRDRPKCRSSGTGRNVVPEQQDRSSILLYFAYYQHYQHLTFIIILNAFNISITNIIQLCWFYAILLFVIMFSPIGFKHI